MTPIWIMTDDGLWCPQCEKDAHHCSCPDVEEYLLTEKEINNIYPVKDAIPLRHSDFEEVIKMVDQAQVAKVFEILKNEEWEKVIKLRDKNILRGEG